MALAVEDAESMLDTVAEHGLVQVMREMVAAPDAGRLGTQLEIARRLRTDPAFRVAWAPRLRRVVAGRPGATGPPAGGRHAAQRCRYRGCGRLSRAGDGGAGGSFGCRAACRPARRRLDLVEGGRHSQFANAERDRLPFRRRTAGRWWRWPGGPPDSAPSAGRPRGTGSCATAPTPPGSPSAACALTRVSQSDEVAPAGRRQRTADLLHRQRGAQVRERHPGAQRPAAQGADDERGGEDITGAGGVDGVDRQRRHPFLLAGGRIHADRALPTAGDHHHRHRVGQLHQRRPWDRRSGCRPSPRRCWAGTHATGVICSMVSVDHCSVASQPTSPKSRVPVLRWPPGSSAGTSCPRCTTPAAVLGIRGDQLVVGDR